MTTRRYFVLIICLIVLLVLIAPQGTVYADQPTPFTDERYGTCWNTHSNSSGITFPQGFDIQVGTIDGSVVRSELDSGNQTIIAVWEFESGTFWNVSHLIYDYYYNGTRDENFAEVEAILLNGAAAVGGKITVLNEPTTFWQEQFPVFTGTLPKANSIMWRLTHSAGGSSPGNQLALHVRQICARLVEGTTPTPTSSPPPVTSTATLTPSETSVPTDTPTGTLPASNTPGPTDTPNPTGTPVIGGVSAGPNVFATIKPPQGCSDVFNPCGQLPFPVPNFGTIALASPTRLSSATASGGGTPFQTPTLLGTPGPGTPTGTATGTLTPGPGVEGIAAIATGAIGYSTALAGGIGTPIPGFGFDGSSEDIRNSANEIGANIGIFFGLLKALQTLFLGRAGTLIAFLLLAVVFIALVKIFTFIMPILVAILHFIIKLLTFGIGGV